MPIKGSVRIKYVRRLKNLEVGTSGYIDSEDIEIVEEKDGTFSLHVDIYTYIYSKEEILNEEDAEDDDEPPPNPFADYVPVKRVGAGLTEKDFILNFKKNDWVFYPQDSKTDRSKQSVVFRNFPVEIEESEETKTEATDQEKSIKDLERERDIALDAKDYAAVTALNQKIESLEKQNKAKRTP